MNTTWSKMTLWCRIEKRKVYSLKFAIELQVFVIDGKIDSVNGPLFSMLITKPFCNCPNYYYSKFLSNLLAACHRFYSWFAMRKMLLIHHRWHHGGRFMPFEPLAQPYRTQSQTQTKVSFRETQQLPKGVLTKPVFDSFESSGDALFGRSPLHHPTPCFNQLRGLQT